MKPDACALLTCNLFTFHAHSADRITEALETENLQARWLAAAAGTLRAWRASAVSHPQAPDQDDQQASPEPAPGIELIDVPT